MKLIRVLLENFGLFRGRNDIDVGVDAHNGSPIVLFAGMNGAGKTTFLEAIQLALYGRGALGERVRQSDYELHLRSRVHRSSGGVMQPESAAVGIEFDYSTMGVGHRYRIVRSWSVKNESTQEHLTVERDNEFLGEVEEQYWQDFVRELIPPGISQLFFFDGEKIQKLAEDEEDYLLSESIKSLLGLDLVERLKSDLQIYRDRQLKRQGNSNVVDALAKAEESVKECVRVAAELQDQRADRVAHRDGIDRTVEGLEQRLALLGGKFAENRSSLSESKVRCETLVDSIERRIRELAETALPFAYCPRICDRLLRQLEQEQESHEHAIITKRSESALERISKAFVVTEPEQVSLLESVLGMIRQEFGLNAESKLEKLVHQLSAESRLLISTWFDQARHPLRGELHKLGGELEATTRELQLVQKRLGQIPEEDSVKPVMEDLSSTLARRAQVDQELKLIDESIRENHGRQEGFEREIRRYGERLTAWTGEMARLDLLERCQGSLESYQARLTRAKITRLEEEVGKCFCRLLRKDDLISRVHIDPDTCHVSLFGRDERPIRKSELSAGEKQMYAVAMLWGLAKTSGRQLPLIIDTPLGRLDSRHRSNLVECYFPQAAEQVIILSTDTEIDKDYYRALSPSIAKSYRLEFDYSTARTSVKEGYFWDKEALCTA